MPDSEMFKLIIQLGSFGLLAVIVIWMLRFGAPMLKQTIEDRDAKFTASLQTMVDSHRVERDQMLTKFDRALERQEVRHDDEKKRRDASFERVSESLDKVANALDDVTDRLERVEARTDEIPTPFPRPRRPHKSEEKSQ